MKLVQSVKVTDKFVEVKYEDHLGDRVDEFSLKMKDAPHPDLRAALQDLAPHVIDVIEQPSAFATDMIVRKCTWAWKENKKSGEMVARVTVHVTKKLKNNNAPLNLHTPLAEPDEDFAVDFELVHDEALAYVDGKRAQGTLPLDGKDTPETPDDPSDGDDE